MPVWWIIIFLVLGLYIIIKGGDLFINAAVGLANATGIPKMLIGATIVSFATVLPEMLISLLAVAKGSPDLSLGNNIGSVIFNTGFILALSLIACPQKITKGFKSKGLLMLASALYLFLAAADKSIGYLDAAGLFLLLGFYIFTSLKEAKKGQRPEEFLINNGRPLKTYLIHFIIGAALIGIGAQVMVANSINLAKILGVSERVIGLTIVAIGSSLPELVTTLTAIRKKEFTMGVGNIIGANTLNLILIPPLCTLIAGGNLPISLQKLPPFKNPVPSTLYIDIPFAILLLFLVVFHPLYRGRLCRRQGIIILLLFTAYFGYILISA